MGRWRRIRASACTTVRDRLHIRYAATIWVSTKTYRDTARASGLAVYQHSALGVGAPQAGAAIAEGKALDVVRILCILGGLLVVFP